MDSNLLRKFLSFSYGSWVGLVIGILTTIITTRILTPEQFGKASMFHLATNMLTIFAIFGTDQAFVRFFYEEVDHKRGGLLYNCMRIPVVVTGLIVAVVLAFYKQLTSFLFGSPSLLLAVMLSIGVASNVLFRFAHLVVRMKQEGHLFSVFSIAAKVSDFVLIIILFMLLGSRYEILIYSATLTPMFLFIILVYIESDYWNLRNFGRHDLMHSQIDIVSYAYPLVLTSLISWLFTSFDKLALKRWSTFEEIGVYGAASKIIALLVALQGSFSTFWAPVCYEHYEQSPKDTKFFEVISRIVAIVMLSLAILTIMFKDVIALVLGSSFREAAYIMPFLVFMPVLHTISETTVIGINFAKKPKWHILIAATACLVNIVGNSLLVPKMGAKGAAIATAVSYFVFFVLRTHISLRYYPINLEFGKLYSILFLIFILALFTTFTNSKMVSFTGGLATFCLLIIVFGSDVKALTMKLKKGPKIIEK